MLITAAAELWIYPNFLTPTSVIQILVAIVYTILTVPLVPSSLVLIIVSFSPKGRLLRYLLIGIITYLMIFTASGLARAPEEIGSAILFPEQLALSIIQYFQYSTKSENQPLYKNSIFGFDFEYDNGATVTDVTTRPYLLMIRVSNDVPSSNVHDEVAAWVAVLSGSKCPVAKSNLKFASEYEQVQIAGKNYQIIEGEYSSNIIRRSICITKSDKTYWFHNDFPVHSTNSLKEKNRFFMFHILRTFKFIK